MEISDLPRKDLAEFMIFADGIGVVVMYNFFLRARISRFAFDFTSVASQVFDFAIRHSRSIYLIGGHAGIAEKAALIFEAVHPNLQISGCHEGFFSS
ncbi:MAG: WecB/TagA/CpsF family glycosyltransferase, partial [Flammeovirgaceae bacterium]